MHSVTRLTVSFLLGAAALSAQEEGIDAAKAEVLRAEAALQAARAAIPTKPVQLAPPEPPKHVETSGFRAAALTFDPTCRPRRLVPGGKGTLTVVVALTGNHVLLADGSTKFTVAQKQGAIAVGTPVFRPATNKERRPLAPAMKNLPVYDDCAIFDVPLEVDADAPEGKQKVAIELAYTLYNGETARPTNPYTDRIEYEVVIGPASVESPSIPEVVGSLRGGSPGSAGTENGRAGDAQRNLPSDAKPVPSGTEAAPIADIDATPTASVGDGEVEGESASVLGGPVLLVAAAAAVLGLVGFLLARRR